MCPVPGKHMEGERREAVAVWGDSKRSSWDSRLREHVLAGRALQNSVLRLLVQSFFVLPAWEKMLAANFVHKRRRVVLFPCLIPYLKIELTF